MNAFHLVAIIIGLFAITCIKSDCPKDCNGQENVICASNGNCTKTFRSPCALENFNCVEELYGRTSFSQVSSGPCIVKQLPHCGIYER